MTLLVIAFIAGVLTVLAPCILPILPVVLGVTALGGNRLLPYVTILSLTVSIVLFTILLKVTTLFIVIPPHVWMWLSGFIFATFGATLIFPGMWGGLSLVSVIEKRLTVVLGSWSKNRSLVGAGLVGVALGPLFSTCSPTYFLILATVLPASFSLGVLYITTYALGLALMLTLITRVGSRYFRHLGTLADPRGWFKRVLGVLFILLGVGIALGSMARFEVWLLGHLPFDVTLVEHMLIERFIYE